MVGPATDLAVDIPSVADADDLYEQYIVRDRIEDPVITSTNAVSVLGSSKFAAPGRSGVCR